MKAPLVSILIPCHNAERYLAATLESAFAQTWPACEVILVDDGSTDRSQRIASQFEDRGLRLLSQPNRGAAAARNLGLQAARGEFVQFLDADDLLASDKIERQLTVQCADDILLVGEWGRFVTHPGEATFSPGISQQARNGIEFLQLHYETGDMVQPGAWLTSRKLLDRAGPWNETLSLNDDGEYFARVMLAASEIRFVPGARCYYRSATPGSLSTRTDAAALTSLYRSVELTLAHFRAVDDSPRTRAAAAYAWKKLAYEVYPRLPDLSRQAERECEALGGSNRPFPGSGRFQFAARLVGWRLARRILDSV